MQEGREVQGKSGTGLNSAEYLLLSKSSLESYRSTQFFLTQVLDLKYFFTNKLCLHFPIFNLSEKLQNIFEIGLKKYMECTNITLGKNILR